MAIRLKLVRKKEEQINKVKDLMEMYNVNPNPNYQGYQPTGASNISNWITPTPMDPRVAKTRDLFQMFHLAR